MRVVKRNKRLWIDDDAGRPVYSPPDFIRLQSRQPLVELSEQIASGDYIGAVMEFEAAARQGRVR